MLQASASRPSSTARAAAPAPHATASVHVWTSTHLMAWIIFKLDEQVAPNRLARKIAHRATA